MDIRGGNRVSQISFVLDSTCNKNFDGEFVIVNAVTMCCEDCQYLHWSHYIVSKIKNVAARLVFGLSSFDNVTSSLHEAIVAAVSRATNACNMQPTAVIGRAADLCDDRIVYTQSCWIKFKLCCLIHAIHHCHSPTYLTQTVQSVCASRPRSGLCSSSTSAMDYSATAAHEARQACIVIRWSLALVRTPWQHSHRGKSF